MKGRVVPQEGAVGTHGDHALTGHRVDDAVIAAERPMAFEGVTGIMAKRRGVPAGFRRLLAALSVEDRLRKFRIANSISRSDGMAA